ncbi:MAG: succinate dehydrogenase, hydrophobic membrane anchor protein [Hyphococcus sp.]|nr:MAG: succinate dehydrogenase, hydrophobic membrane anchor protein [Marinicaulis sp.]
MSKKGTSNFVIQRATAVILAPLGLWFLFNLVAVLGADSQTATAFMKAPWNGILLGLFIVAGAWHMRLGMEEIIVDYIHSWLKDVLVFLNWLTTTGLMAASIWAIYNISFAG